MALSEWQSLSGDWVIRIITFANSHNIFFRIYYLHCLFSVLRRFFRKAGDERFVSIGSSTKLNNQLVAQ